MGNWDSFPDKPKFQRYFRGPRLIRGGRVDLPVHQHFCLRCSRDWDCRKKVCAGLPRKGCNVCFATMRSQLAFRLGD
jgi:hypothetical protein